MSAALTAQPGLHSTATAVSTKAKVRGRNRMAGGACATESCPMTHSSSSSASSLMEVVVSTMATFLVGGWAEEQVGRRGGIHEDRTRCSHVAFLSTAETVSFSKHFSRSSRVSFHGFSLVSMSIAFGSLEGAFLVGVGVWNATGVLDECCLATKAAKRHWLRNWSIFSYHPLGVVGITSMP